MWQKPKTGFFVTLRMTEVVFAILVKHSSDAALNSNKLLFNIQLLNLTRQRITPHTQLISCFNSAAIGML